MSHQITSFPSSPPCAHPALMKSPPLQTNQSKSELLFDSFFKPHNNPNTNLAVTTFPEPICEFQNITNKQIHREIERLSPFKAPGPNGVCNVVFTKNADMLVPHLGHIFRVTFNLKWYPEQWKTLSTIVIQKPGNPNYLLPKVYHAIALLDTMAKILSSYVADNLTYCISQNTTTSCLAHTSVEDQAILWWTLSTY